MITSQEIMDGIKKRLFLKLGNGVFFYLDFLPEEFVRPSILIEFEKESSVRLNLNFFKKEKSFIITYKGETNAHHRSRKEELCNKLDIVLQSFLEEVLSVGDRHILASDVRSGLPGDEDEAVARVSFEYTECIIKDETDVPKMGSLHINGKQTI